MMCHCRGCPQKSKLFDKSPRLQRLERLLNALEKLHPTVTGEERRVKARQPKLLTDLRRNEKKLTNASKKMSVSTRCYGDDEEMASSVIEYINGKSDKEEKKRKREAEKAARKKEREAKALARPVKRAKSAYAIFSTEVGGKIKEENPDSSSADLTKLKQKQWKELADADTVSYTHLTLPTILLV